MPTCFTALRLTMASLCLAALASTAHAAVDPTVIPLNSQVGSLRIPLQCSFPLIGKQTLTIKLTGSMATTVTPGQPFYLTDGSGVLEMPQTLVDLAYSLLGARQATGLITELNFNLTNATPATINGLSSPIAINSQPFAKGQPVDLMLPPTGFIQIGPMTAMNQAGQVLVKMGSAKGSIQLQTAAGKTILWDLGVSCSAPDPAIIVLGMTVGGTHTDAVSAPHTNIRTEDLDTPYMTQTGSLRFPLSCNVQGLGTRALDGTFTGVAPALYAPGEVFTAASGFGRIVVPASVVNELLDQEPSVVSGSTVVDVLQFSASNTSPSMLDMAANGPITGSDVTIQRGQAAMTRFPASTNVAVGPFKASSAATAKDTSLYVGRTGAVVKLKNAGGQVIDTRRIDCDVPSPATTLVSVSIGGAAVSPAHISSLLPVSGAATGGQTVYIAGSNFTNARAVSFGGVPAKSFTVVASGLIAAVTPALPTGAQQVLVQGVGGSDNTAIFTVK